MSFNKGYELKKFEAHWEKLRIEYVAAGMTEDAIQKMYDYDRQQFNSERTFVERTQEFTAPAYESSEEEASPFSPSNFKSEFGIIVHLNSIVSFW